MDNLEVSMTVRSEPGSGETAEAEDAATERALELLRIDEDWRVAWPKALAGDQEAVDRVLELSDARCRLLGLYPTRTA